MDIFGGTHGGGHRRSCHLHPREAHGRGWDDTTHAEKKLPPLDSEADVAAMPTTALFGSCDKYRVIIVSERERKKKKKKTLIGKRSRGTWT